MTSLQAVSKGTPGTMMASKGMMGWAFVKARCELPHDATVIIMMATKWAKMMRDAVFISSVFRSEERNYRMSVAKQTSTASDGFQR